VAYTLDGSLTAFQQQAVVAANAMTPANLSLSPVNFVNVTFSATAPKTGIDGLPVRIIGSSYALGNTFADLSGGLSTIASRAPLMALNSDGKYSITLKMPVGYDLRYKYTLGDGLWNGELNAEGGFNIRQLIVPDHDITVDDMIATWSAPNSNPISFTVKVPDYTPQTDTVSIQFNPFGWTEPIPMWPTGTNQWMMILYNPQNLLGDVGYRYCRNDACGLADDQTTAGTDTSSRTFTAKNVAQDIQDQVTNWQWLSAVSSPTTVVADTVTPRGADFIQGVEFSSFYRPAYQGYQNWAFKNIQEIGANEVILSPTWTYTSNNPPVLEPGPGADALWPDVMASASLAQQYGQQVVIYPTMRYTQDSDAWWKSAEKSNSWWRTWFDRYHTFVINTADMAAKANAKAIILGEPGMKPALPNGVLSDGTTSNVLPEAAQLWKQMIADVRARYSGQILWAMSYPQDLKNVPGYLSDVDGIYLEWSAQMADAPTTNVSDLQAAFSKKFDSDVKPLQESLKKPIFLALRYPSASGSSKGCVDFNGSCIAFGQVDDYANINRNVTINLAEQAALYNGALAAVNTSPYISGFITEGYLPVAGLQDSTSSVHGKPASDVIWYWFQKMKLPVQ
jgi:hypothetical protein